MTESPKKIILLGGSGFIGTRLTSELLRAGHDVAIGDIAPSVSYPDLHQNADVRSLETLLPFCAEGDIIINLAAAHRDNVRPISLYYDTNVTGARIVCEAAEKSGIQKIIFTSSVAVYGHQQGEPDETASHHPIGPYGETKSQAEDVYKEWFQKDPRNRMLIIIRPTVVFGPGNRGNVHMLMDQVAKGRFIMVGRGQNKKSMAYVGNVAAFIQHALSLEMGLHIFNYIDKPDFSMAELIDLIRARTGKSKRKPFYLPQSLGQVVGGIFDVAAELTGKTFPISRVRVDKFCATTIFKSDRKHQYGFQAPTSLKEALVTTIDSEFLHASLAESE